MLVKFVLIACLVACVKAGNLIQQPLALAAPSYTQIRYAPTAPIITKSTIYHPASAPASISYQAQAPAQIAYHAPTPAQIAYHAPVSAQIAYHAPEQIALHAAAPAQISYQAPAHAIAFHAPAPAQFAYHAAAPALLSYQAAPQYIRYGQPQISYPAPTFLKAVAPAPTLVKAIAPAPALIKTSPALIKAKPDEDYDPNPQYTFAYEVQDSLTGDVKSQSETRNGDSVQGTYSLNEPDGTRRTVDYTADPVNGFNAIVRKEPIAQAVPAKIAAPIAFAPPPAKISAPIPLSAPQLRLAAPVAYAAPAAAYTAH